MKTEDIPFGKHLLRVQRQKDGWAGIVVGHSTDRFQAETREALIARLQAHVGQAAPGFVGYDGARSRFLSQFPEGFSDPGMGRDDPKGESGEKLALSRRVERDLPLDGFRDMPDACERALRIFRATSMIDPYAKTNLANVLRSPDGPEFLGICADFADGRIAEACGQLTARFRDRGVAKWTCVTYLPFFWRPDRHMFLKPEFTREYAERVGHRFAVNYSATPNPDSYAALLDMANDTRKAVADLGPQDMIDIHSFMWATVMYPDPDAQPT